MQSSNSHQRAPVAEGWTVVCTGLQMARAETYSRSERRQLFESSKSSTLRTTTNLNNDHIAQATSRPNLQLVSSNKLYLLPLPNMGFTTGFVCLRTDRAA